MLSLYGEDAETKGRQIVNAALDGSWDDEMKRAGRRRGERARRALVVDHDPLSRAFLEIALAEFGAEAISFESPSEALRRLRNWPEDEPVLVALVAAGRDPAEDAALVALLRATFGPRLAIAALLEDDPGEAERAPANLAAACDAALLKPLRPGAVTTLLAAAFREAEGG